MRALVATATAVLLAATLAASPAMAWDHWHGGHHHGYRDGGWAGPALVFGLAAGVLAAGAAAECSHFEPIYDDYGYVVGRRRVWGC